MRRVGFAALFLLSLALASPSALAQDAEQAASIARAERIGRDLYEHDRAGWLATDEMLRAIPASERGDLRGWVTMRDGDAVIVDFVAERGGALWTIHRSTYRNGALTDHGRIEIPLDDARQRILRARQIAIEANPPICGAPYNVATLPPDAPSEADADIYLMPATQTAGDIRIGGFVRLAVDVDASAVVTTETFSRSCLRMPSDNASAGIMFTHLTQPMPTETHVFLNLSHGLPIYLTVQENLWSIEDGRIRLVPR